MSVVLVLIGSSIGPAIAAIYMQTHQELAKGVGSSSFPSPVSYNLIFLTAALISVISVLIGMILKRRMTQSSLKKSEMEASN